MQPKRISLRLSAEPLVGIQLASAGLSQTGRRNRCAAVECMQRSLEQFSSERPAATRNCETNNVGRIKLQHTWTLHEGILARGPRPPATPSSFAAVVVPTMAERFGARTFILELTYMKICSPFISYHVYCAEETFARLFTCLLKFVCKVTSFLDSSPLGVSKCLTTCCCCSYEHTHDHRRRKNTCKVSFCGVL